MADFLFWCCPYCNQNATIGRSNISDHDGVFQTIPQGVDGIIRFDLQYIVCPNPKCRKYTLDLRVGEAANEPNPGRFHNWVTKRMIAAFRLIPKGRALIFPDYVPEQLRRDYAEAHLILEDSPNASATLARRCVQGIIRQFYGIQKPSLFDEIQAMKDIVDSDLWDAIDAVRSLGNFGAHMKGDVNLIVNVEPGEAEALLGLIELLFRETYIAQRKRQESLLKVKEAADATKQRLDDSKGI